MPYVITYGSECDCVIAWIDGVFGRQMIGEFVAELSRVISANGSRRLLTDLRGAELTLSIVDLYFAPRWTLEAGISPAIRSAVVVVEKDWSKYSFLETVAS